MVCNSKTFYKTSPLYLPGFEFLSLKQDKELSKQEIKKIIFQHPFHTYQEAN